MHETVAWPVAALPCRVSCETALPAGIAQAQVDSPVATTTADDVAALSVFPYCACTDYNCAADAYTLSNATITPGTPTVNMCFNLSYVSVGTLCARAAQDPLHGCAQAIKHVLSSSMSSHPQQTHQPAHKPGVESSLVLIASNLVVPQIAD